MTDHVRADDSTRTGSARPETKHRLARLDELDDFEIADGEPDIRGWKVKSADGVDIGKVEGLIADPAAMQVCYVEVKIQKELLDSEDDESVMIPISAARLNDDDDTVILSRVESGRLREAPRFGRGPLTDDHHKLLIVFFGPSQTSRDEDSARFFGNRRAGRADAKYFRNSNSTSEPTHEAPG